MRVWLQGANSREVDKENRLRGCLPQVHGSLGRSSSGTWAKDSILLTCLLEKSGTTNYHAFYWVRDHKTNEDLHHRDNSVVEVHIGRPAIRVGMTCRSSASTYQTIPASDLESTFPRLVCRFSLSLLPEQHGNGLRYSC